MTLQNLYGQARKLLDESANPLYFYHDDPDGLCSYLILKRFYKKGHGHMVKASPYLTEDFLPRVEEHKSDLIVVLDIAHIEDDFIQQAKLPIIWIDHHDPNPKKGTLYINPKSFNHDDNKPASWLSHELTGSDFWLGTVGSVSDWVVPEGIEKLDIAAKPYEPPNLLYNSPLGTLVKVLSFNLKGTHSEVKRSIAALEKINSPEEILQQKTPEGEILWKKYSKINREYEEQLRLADSQRSQDPMIIYTYHEYHTSLTKDLANEMYARHPDKIILLGREKSGKVMFSLRANKNLPPALEKAFVGLIGKGGGHEHACGGWVNADDFPVMARKLKELL